FRYLFTYAMNLQKTILIAFLLFLTSFCFGNQASDDLKRYSDSVINLIAKEKDYQKVRVYITDLLNKNYVTNTPFVVKYIEDNILDKPQYMGDTIFYANTLNTYAISFFDTDIHKSIAIAQKDIDYIGNSSRQRYWRSEPSCILIWQMQEGSWDTLLPD